MSFPFANILLAVILASISLLHYYWLFGGKKALAIAVPRLNSAKALFRPGKFSILVVATGLAFLAFSVLDFGSFWPQLLNADIRNKILKLFAIVFTVRAIGDFRFVGFFSRLEKSEFSYWDKRVFSPLSLSMGLLLVLVS